jgi:2'-hydroxyisoflavone reductase
MRILLLGGTVFLGRHVADEALRRGHELTLFSRGLHGTVPEGVEHVIGDRADVTPLQGRTWDAAIDTSGYEPRNVAASAALDVGHYVFVSSVSAYERWPEEPVDEDSPVSSAEIDEYGALKAACERAAQAAKPTAIVRGGLIVGPHDNVFRLPWWVRRMNEPGPVPAPGHPDEQLQLIDARDLAAFLVDLAENRTSGIFNGTAPIGQTTMREVLTLAGDAELKWVPDDVLLQAEVEPWTELPLWLPATYAGTWRVGTAKAQHAGLRCRPIAETVADVRAWLEGGGEREIGDWKAENRPPRMSREREDALFRLLC